MGRSWAIDSGLLLIDLSTATGEGSPTGRYLDDWRHNGWLDGTQLRLPLEEWCRVGVPLAPAVEADEREYWHSEWAAEHDALCATLSLKQESIELELVGLFGAPGSRIQLKANGRNASTAFDEFGFPTDPTVALPLSPLSTWVASQLRAFPPDRNGQLLSWARVRTALDTLAPRLRTKLDAQYVGFLGEVIPERPERFSLSFESSGHAGRQMTLRPSIVGEDGQLHPIDYAHFDPRGLVVQNAKRPIVLPPDVAKVLERTRQFDRRRPADIRKELSDPTLVIPQGVEVDRYFDLSHYSDRVSGFERIDKSEQPIIKNSGIAWFDLEAGHQEAFGVIVAQTTSGAVRKICLETEETVTSLLEQTRKALDAGATTVSGTPLRATPELLNQLLAILKVNEAPAEEPATESEERTRPGTVAAVIMDLAACQSDAAAISIDESTVPWSELQNLLAQGVSLKDHQRLGISWMWAHLKSSAGALLADDMGLGKTLQAACVVALRAKNSAGTNLIVCPTVLIGNWLSEIERFFRGAAFGRVLVLHEDGLARARRGIDGLNPEFIAQHQLVITNYETLAKYQRSLLTIAFDVVVLDEVQNIKNPETLRSRAARGLKRNFALALTGTPVENTLTDIWAIYDALQTRPPRSFGTRAEFETDFTERGIDGIAELRRRLEFPSRHSTLLRREKADALKDLPPKRYEARFVEMTEEQEEQERMIARSVSSRGALFALDRLRKLYQHPALLHGDSHVTIKSSLRQSPKTQLTLDILREIEGRQEKVLIFTLWHQMQDLLVQLTKENFGLRRVHIINGDPANRRNALARIEDFSNARGFDVMVLSPIAAGVGLTITAANHVIHYGRWWNPAKEDQATDRAYRIGQTRPVTVYYPTLHRRGRQDAGFDVRLHQLVEKKRAVARDFLAPSEGLDLSEATAAELLREER